jgi:hypothetical protein
LAFAIVAALPGAGVALPPRQTGYVLCGCPCVCKDATGTVRTGFTGLHISVGDDCGNYAGTWVDNCEVGGSYAGLYRGTTTSCRYLDTIRGARKQLQLPVLPEGPLLRQ